MWRGAVPAKWTRPVLHAGQRASHQVSLGLVPNRAPTRLPSAWIEEHWAAVKHDPRRHVVIKKKEREWFLWVCQTVCVYTPQIILPATVAREAEPRSALRRVNTGAGVSLHLEGNHGTPTFFFFPPAQEDQRPPVEHKNCDFILENEPFAN